MPMDSNVLIKSIKGRMTSELGVDFSQQTQEDALSITVEEIIKHIQAFATVSTTVQTAVIGTLPAGPVAATGSGAGVGTVS